jgi:hypothetical protein
VADAKDFLEALGYDLEEIKKRDDELTRSRKKSPSICLCGHPISSHTKSHEGDVYCKPSRMFCHCEKARPVVIAEDNRLFYRKTNSYGSEHALIRGAIASMAKNKKIEWIEESYACSAKGCKVKGLKNRLQPALLDVSKYVVENGYPKGKLLKNYKLTKQGDEKRELLDVLLCPAHLDEYVLESR